MELAIGDLAVYPAHGVGRIEAIEEKKLDGKIYNFYVMRILENNMKILIPAHNIVNVGLRPLISKAEANKIFKLLRETPVIGDASNWNRRQRDYLDKLKTGSLIDVAEVLRELLTMRADKELSFGERKLLDTAKMLIVKELALARDQKEEKVENDIMAIFPPPKLSV